MRKTAVVFDVVVGIVVIVVVTETLPKLKIKKHCFASMLFHFNI